LASQNGHLDFVKWLVKKFNLTVYDVCTTNFFAIRWACYNGHLELAKWFLEEFESIGTFLTNLKFLKTVSSRNQVQVMAWTIMTLQPLNLEKLRKRYSNFFEKVDLYIQDLSFEDVEQVMVKPAVY